MIDHNSRSLLRASSKKLAKKNAVVQRAAFSTFEHLESRQLLSGTPVLTIAGNPNTNEGSDYSLSLSSQNLGSLTIDHWDINWGDGTSEVPGSATTADHVYADGPNTYTVGATATLSDNSVVAANLGAATVTSDGQLDASFNGNGKVISPMPGAGTAAGLAIESNGQIIQAGTNTGNILTLVRYNTDGSVDTNFGVGGQATVPGATQVSKMIIETVPNPFGTGTVQRLLVAGDVNGSRNGALWRFNLDNAANGLPDGSPDTTFNGTGFKQLPNFIGGNPGNNIASVTIDPNGQIVTAGTTWGFTFDPDDNQSVSVARLNPDGTMDTSFNGTGEQVNQLSGFFDGSSGLGVVAGADGSVEALTFGTTGGVYTNFLMRFTSAGAVDTSFGPSGIVGLNNTSNNFVTMTSDANGKILLGGSHQIGSSSAFEIGRYNYDGSLDTSFGGSGLVGTVVDNPGGLVTALTATPDGKIVAVGKTQSSFNGPAQGTVNEGVIRLNGDGTLDTGFGDVQSANPSLRTGITRIDFLGGPDTAEAVAIQSDLKVVIGGEAFNTGPQNWTLARLGTNSAASGQPVTVAVANVAPVAALSAAPSSNAEGTAISLTGSATDAGSVDQAAGFTFVYDITKTHGTTTVDLGSVTTAAGLGTVPINFTPDDDGTYNVTLTATDKDGAVSSVTSESITVTNVAPTPSITAPTTGTEGSAISVSGSATDPSSADTSAGFTFAWSVTKNGNAFGSTGSGSSFSFTPDDNGTYVVSLTATDKDGGSNSTTSSISVANAAPTAHIVAPSTGTEGSAISVSGSATDPSSADTAAGFTFAWSVTKNGNAFGSTGPGSSFSFTPDDNGSYVVTLTATDKDGGSNSTNSTVAVSNVAPTPSIVAPSTGTEGSAISVSGSATDPSSVDTAAGFTFAWTVTKNGNAFGATGSSTSYSFTPDDNGTYIVKLTATDKDGGSNSTTSTVNVSNVAPTPSITAPTTGNEGSAISVSGSATDPSSVDTAAGFTLAWSVTKNGNAFGSAGSGANYSFTPDDNGTYVVKLTATDKDGGSNSTTKTINVANVAPTVGAITGPSHAVRGQNVTFADSFSDPGTADTHTITWNYGDGSAVASSSSGAGVTGAISSSHVYTANGTFTVKVTVTDKDGGTSSSTKSITIDTVDIQTDPNNPGKTALFIGGTSNGDVITVTPTSGNKLQVYLNGTTTNFTAPTGRIVIFGGAGDDVIQVADNISLPTEIYGGDGNDLIKAGSGPSIEVGGTGNDVLVGGSGRNILIGGGGNDVLVAGSGDDVLVAMATIYDSNQAALESIQNEWIRTDASFSTRVNDLTHGGGLNGSNVLTAATTFNDNASDLLSGGSGDDLFIVSGTDLVTDAGHADDVVDLSWITV